MRCPGSARPYSIAELTASSVTSSRLVGSLPRRGSSPQTRARRRAVSGLGRMRTVASVTNRLGEEGRGFAMLMGKLAHERLTQAVRSICVCEAAIGWTVDYTRERKAFGGSIGDLQNTQFVLAGLAAETASARAFTDRCIAEHIAGALEPVDAAKVKLVVTDLHNKVVDQCLQFFGGYGYMSEYPIARAYIDARITRIAGGAAEVMKQIIGRDLFARAGSGRDG